ncbi:MAG: mechanosensitive ion channel family protein [Gammaproteobacteria bacterium]|nr:mechanosensitive ion channel family protein [Gammaproteobacteria bacterium]
MEWFKPLFDIFGEHPYMRSVIALLLGFAIANLVTFIISRIVAKLVSRTGNQLDDAVTMLMRAPVYWTVILVGVLAAVILLELPEGIAAIGRSFILSLLIVIWSIFVVSVLRVVLKSVSSRAGMHSLVRPQTLPLFNNMAVIFVLVLSIYLFFETWNIDMTAWLASAGIIGIAVGFAAKDTLANLFAGVFILADSPYKIGDYVVLEGAERGKVTHIGIRSTRILTRDDVEVTIPNSIMGNTRVINESGGPHEKFRIRVPVGVAYGSDIDMVRSILLDVAVLEQQVCADPEPRVRFRRFGNSALEFELLCWVDNPELRGRVIDVLNTAIYKQFMQHGIEIPYSKHDVYIKEMPRTPGVEENG